MSKLETNTIDTVSGTSNLTIGSTNTSTITVPNGKLTGHNYPAFMSYNNNSSSQTISNSTWTEVTIMDQEALDTNNAFNTSTGRFTPSVAGKYYFTGQIFAPNGIGANFNSISIAKNGNVQINTTDELGYISRIFTADTELQVNGILTLNDTDYVSIFINQQTGGNIGIGGGSGKACGFFGGFRIGA
jgi:hypothetical protein